MRKTAATGTAPSRLDEDVVDSLIAEWRRERPDLQVDSMNVIGRLTRLGRSIEEQTARVLKGFDLDYSEFDVLATLRRSGKPYELTPTGLRRSVLLSSGAMTACLDRLELRRLVDRRRDPTDRRSTTARLTASGRKLIEAAFPARIACAVRQVSPLADREQEALANLLRKLQRQG